VSEPVTDRNSEFFSATFGIKDNEPVNERKRESCLTKFVADPNDPATALNNEFFSARFEDGLSEATRALPIPLAMEPAKLIEPVRDLKADACFARPEAIFQFVVRVVEQEWGLELQVSFPESTLADVLPIAFVIESVSVLRMEFFSARLDAWVMEPAKERKKENFWARFDARVSETLSVRRNEACSTKFEAGVSASLSDLRNEDFSARLETAPRAVEKSLT
jgi:hypothetical protein